MSANPPPLRAQYHFRHDARGLLAWDVRRLVQRARHLPQEEVPLQAIRELDESYWYGSEGDVPTCRSIAAHMRLIEAADLAFPVILDPDGRVMDGMHRVVKALLAGQPAIRARRLPELPPPDFIGVDACDLPYDD